MAREVSAYGASVKLRRPGAVFLLTLITLGIYGAVWYHRVNRELRGFGGAYGDEPLATSRPGRSLLAVTLGALVVVPAIVSLFRFVGRVRRAERIGGTRLTSGWLVVILGVVGSFLLLPGYAILAYVQSDLNELWRRYDAEPASREGRSRAKLRAWLLRGEERPLRPPPDWLFRPVVGVLLALGVIGLALTPVWPIGLVVLLVFAIEVYEDCRAHGFSRFWWPSAAASYGPLVFLAYVHSRNETLANRHDAPVPTPGEYRRAKATQLPPAGWYPDPLGEAAVRYWDGARWTHDLRR